jgi:hypothetical protein
MAEAKHRKIDGLAKTEIGDKETLSPCGLRADRLSIAHSASIDRQTAQFFFVCRRCKIWPAA